MIFLDKVQTLWIIMSSFQNRFIMKTKNKLIKCKIIKLIKAWDRVKFWLHNK